MNTLFNLSSKLPDNNKVTFVAVWNGELAAGIRGGQEYVTISFAYGTVIDNDLIDYFRESIKEYFDGSRVYTEQEYNEECRSREAEMRETE